MTGDQPLPGFDTDAADQSECEVCSEARLDLHIKALEHFSFAAGSVHVLLWSPPGWAAEFGHEIGCVIVSGLDAVPMAPDEAEQVARALLDAADRVDR